MTRCLSITIWLLSGLLLPVLGCRGPEAQSPATIVTDFSTVPRESNKVVMPPYVIEPPDILLIDAVRAVPKAPYRLKTGDVIAIEVLGTPSNLPITGPRQIEPGGVVRLGPRYDAVNVAHLTLEEAQYNIREYLRQFIRDPIVTVSLVEIAGKQQIAGQHLVGPDGTVTLGIYGSVRVVGMNLAQAKHEIEQYLSQYLDEPEVSLEVWAFNSKVYYIVTQGAGLGDAVYKFPITGNETVLDAIAQINGLNQLSSKQIWIARPYGSDGKCQILPVDWNAITSYATAGTNFQVMPGDRVFVAEDKFVALDNGLAKLLAPAERIMGFSVFGVGAATRFSGPVMAGGGNPRSNF
jgi:protein involved in polysaccharide export with SLBB domain